MSDRGAPLPSVDDILGAPKDLPSVDDILGKPVPENNIMRYREAEQNQGGSAGPPLEGPMWDNFASQGTMGHALDAFGAGVKQGWGAEPVGISDETADYYRKAGIFNDYQNGRTSIIRSFNEAFMRPAAVALDAALRGSTAIFRGAQAMGEQLGVPREILALPEAFPTGLHGMGAPGAFRAALTDARSLNVVGPGGDAAWQDLTEAPPATDAEQGAAIKPTIAAAAAGEQEGGQGAVAPQSSLTFAGEGQSQAAETPAPDLHAVARQIAPEVFDEYDTLDSRRQTFSDWMRELRSRGAEDSPEVADVDRQLDELRTARSEAQQAAQRLDIGNQITALEQQRQGLVDNFPERNAAELSTVQEAFQRTDERMRDLAPQVSAAYRQAESGTVAEPAPAAPEVAPPAETGEAPVEPRPTQEAAPAAETAPPAAEPQTVAPVPDIAADVSQKLQAAGRPVGEADAAAELVAAHYQARAARLEGVDADTLYRDEGPQIEPGTGGRRGAGGSTVLRDGQTVINLFGRADASTFIHETGHQWLEELVRDAGDERAKPEVQADADAVHSWLGSKSGEPISTRQHEKFARGFERYMMEGTAPSRALAGVFSKFRDWLTSIYQTVSKLRSPITDDIRGVFDRMLAEKPERVTIAPEREAPADLIERHEASVATTPPEHAGAVADVVHEDADAIARAQVPEEHDELGRGTEEAGGNAASGGATDGNGNAAEPVAGEARDNQEPRTIGPSREEAPAAGGGARTEPLPLQVKVPRRPLSLVDFLKKEGGLKDDTFSRRINTSRGREDAQSNPTELRTLAQHPKAKGLIRARNGMSMDDAALRAWEAGYFPELGDERPSINDLYEAIDEDLNGPGRFSVHDGNAAREYQEAIAHNAEIDRIARELDINSEGMSHAEFWDAVAERQSVEKTDQQAADMAAEHDEAYAEAERRTKEWLESRGDAWEPDVIYDEPEARSQEDLDRAYQQEEAAHAAGERPGGNELPGTPGGDQGAVQAVGGQGGGGAGADGRAGAAGSTERPTGPNDAFTGRRTDLVDKAGNIRLDKLNTTGDVDAIIQELAGENDDFIAARRGVVSDQDVINLASAMGLKPSDLSVDQLRSQYSPERIRATRELFVQSATDAFEKSKAAAAGDDAAVLAYMQARSRLRMVQEYLSAITAETGRGQRAFRTQIGGMDRAKDVAAIMGDLSEERTLYQMREEAKRLARFDTPAKVSGFLRDADKPSLSDKILEVYVNWLISGPFTHIKYVLGNEILSMWTAVPELAARAAVGTVQRALGVKGAEASPYFGEVGWQSYALLYGQKRGLKAAYDSVKAGQTMPLPGELGKH